MGPADVRACFVGNKVVTRLGRVHVLGYVVVCLVVRGLDLIVAGVVFIAIDVAVDSEVDSFRTDAFGVEVVVITFGVLTFLLVTVGAITLVLTCVADSEVVFLTVLGTGFVVDSVTLLNFSLETLASEADGDPAVVVLACVIDSEVVCFAIVVSGFDDVVVALVATSS